MSMKLDPNVRRYDLDWLRIIAFGLLIFYHVGMFYVTWGWHVKSVYASPAVEPLMEVVAPWRLDQATAVRIAQSDLNFIAANRTQHIEQISHIEADFQAGPLIIDLELLVRFFLLGIMRLNSDVVLLKVESNAAVFLIRENRGP